MDLLDLHFASLDVRDANGDTTVTNDPFEPNRRPAPRFRAAWDDRRLACIFRHDVDTATRRKARAWIDRQSDPDPRGDLPDLAAIFGVDPGEIGFGLGYTTDAPIDDDRSAIAITPANAGRLPAGFLEPGEIHSIPPAFAIQIDDRFVSTCITVRRTPDSIEAGTNTLAPHRGRGYAVSTTAAWVNAALSDGLVPFYSTSIDNVASQRVAEKVGLRCFNYDLRIV